MANGLPTRKGTLHGQQIAVKPPPLRLVNRGELDARQLEIARVHACGGCAWVPQPMLVQPGFPPFFTYGWGFPVGYPHPQYLFHRAIPTG